MEIIVKEKDGYSLVRIENVRYGMKTQRYEIRSIGGYVQGISGHSEKKQLINSKGNMIEKSF